MPFMRTDTVEKFSWECQSAQVVLLDDEALVALTQFLEEFKRRQINLKLVSFQASLATPGDFAYRFEFKDGRVWQQTIRIPTGDAPISMTFNVPAFFTQAEFKDHHAVLDSLMWLHKTRGIVTFQANWK